MNSIAAPAVARRSNATLWWIVALLIAPVLLATALYVGGWHPTGKPYGSLLQPPQPLPSGMLSQTEDARGKWLILVDAHAGCDVTCANRIDAVRRVHVSLDKKMSRVRRGVIADEAGTARAAVASQPDVTVVAPDPLWRGTSGTVLLVDPNGRVALRYDAGTEPKAIRADVDRLLRFTWNG